jgi:hypothetical protein
LAVNRCAAAAFGAEKEHRHKSCSTALIDAPRSIVFNAIGRLRDAGVLRALTDRRRNQI